MRKFTKALFGTSVAVPLVATLAFDATLLFSIGGWMPSETSCVAFREASVIEPVIKPTSTPEYPFEAEVFRHAYSQETAQNKCARKLAIDIQKDTGLFFANGIGPDKEDVVVRGYVTDSQEMNLLEVFLKEHNLYCVPLLENTEQLQRRRMLLAQEQQGFSPIPITM